MNISNINKNTEENRDINTTENINENAKNRFLINILINNDYRDHRY